MNGISLTASMRSNLLSLQNISGQVSSTQNKLATGNKVNSAIDNPSSYYTALSLNNRADDLNALLDSMGQAVSTIKAATTALDTGTEVLNVLADLALQAYESDDFSDEKVAIVVSNKAELLSAIENTSAQDGVIVIDSDIDMGNTSIQLKEGQQLIGIGQIVKGKNTPKLTFHFTGTESSTEGIVVNNSCRISGLDISYTIDEKSKETAIVKGAKKKDCIVSDVNIEGTCNGTNATSFLSALDFQTGSCLLQGNISIKMKTDRNAGSLVGCYGNFIQEETSIVNIHIDQGWRNIPLSSGGFDEYRVSKDANLLMEGYGNIIQANLVLEQGSKVASHYISNNLSGLWIVEETTTITEWITSFDNQEGLKYLEDFPQDEFDKAFEDKEKEGDNKNSYIERYQETCNQLNQLWVDASYKGVNLLQGDELIVRLNEDGGSSFKISCSAINKIDDSAWMTYSDIMNSLEEIRTLTSDLRTTSQRLGNFYSIITTRQDFTESLINVLTEGADKLTLADMNEESANMLALQTRQQLAINSLSLASQACQSMLKLF